MNYHSFHFLAPAITLYAPTSVLEQDRWFHPGFSTCLSLCLNLSLLSYHPPSSSGSLSLWAQSSLNPAQVHPAFLSWSFWTFVSSIFFSTLYVVSYPRVLPFQLNVQVLGMEGQVESLLDRLCGDPCEHNNRKTGKTGSWHWAHSAADA